VKTLAQFGGKNKTASTAEAVVQGTDRSLTLLVEGAVRHIPQVDPAVYESFSTRVSSLAMQMPDRLPEAEKLLYIRKIVKEFENYRTRADAMLRERLIGWRALVSTLLKELFANLGIEPSSMAAQSISSTVGNLTTSEEIANFCAHIAEFLHPGGAAGAAAHTTSPLRVADRTTANDNAAGLRGGGAAVAHVQRVKERGGKGYVAVFRLSFLDVISERFGMDAVQDCIMAVSAYLTHSLRATDAIYHWSDTSLMGVLEDRANPQIVNAELSRIAAQNRDITINITGRAVMFRIPIEFELIPIDRLSNADDLNWISGHQAVQR
jgi:hypothetical protein